MNTLFCYCWPATQASNKNLYQRERVDKEDNLLWQGISDVKRSVDLCDLEKSVFVYKWVLEKKDVLSKQNWSSQNE